MDGNAIGARTYYATHKDDAPFDQDLFISTFLRSILSTLVFLSDKRAIICIDSRKCWRKEIFPGYKASRKREGRTGENYYKYISALNDICAELKVCMPIGVVQREGYEADDLEAYFAALPGTHVIVTTDHDMWQLSQPGRVVIYDNFIGDFVTVKDPKLHLHQLICLGSDDVPHVVPVDPKSEGPRKNKMFKFGEKTIEKMYDPTSAETCFIKKEFLEEQVSEKKLDKLETITERYAFNKRLIDLSQSPVFKEIIEFKVRKFNLVDAQGLLDRYRVEVNHQKTLEALQYYG